MAQEDDIDSFWDGIRPQREPDLEKEPSPKPGLLTFALRNLNVPPWVSQTLGERREEEFRRLPMLPVQIGTLRIGPGESTADFFERVVQYYGGEIANREYPVPDDLVDSQEEYSEATSLEPLPEGVSRVPEPILENLMMAFDSLDYPASVWSNESGLHIALSDVPHGSWSVSEMSPDRGVIITLSLPDRSPWHG